MTRSWVRSVYHRKNFSRRAATTSRPIITQSLWKEANTQYLHDIASAVRTCNIPDELILNADQKPSKYVPTTNVRMAEQGTAHIPVRGGVDKRAITVTGIQSLSGKMLPFKNIYTGKNERCLPKNAAGKENFLFPYNEKYWSNDVGTSSLIDEIIPTYIENVKRELQVPNDQKSLLIWEAFKGQGTPRVQERFAELSVVVVMVSKNMTHLLQSLDVTTYSTIKKIEEKQFNNYIASVFTKEMLIDSSRDVTTIKIDLKLSTLKPLHLNTQIFNYLKTSDGESIFKLGF